MSSRQIFKTISITIAIMLLSTIILAAAFCVALPKTSARFAYNLGSGNVAARLYFLDYNRTKDINSLALALNSAIETDQHESIVEYSQYFFNHSDYDSYIDYRNQVNLNIDVNALIKSTIINEDNYYKNIYVAALLQKKQAKKAFDFSVEEQNISPQLSSLGCYAFNLFTHAEYLPLFFNEHLTGTVISFIEDYFDNLYLLYEGNNNQTTLKNQHYYIALASRIIMVGNDIKYVYSNSNMPYQHISVKVTQVTEWLGTLLEGE